MELAGAAAAEAGAGEPNREAPGLAGSVVAVLVAGLFPKSDVLEVGADVAVVAVVAGVAEGADVAPPAPENRLEVPLEVVGVPALACPNREGFAGAASVEAAGVLLCADAAGLLNKLEPEVSAGLEPNRLGEEAAGLLVFPNRDAPELADCVVAVFWADASPDAPPPNRPAAGFVSFLSPDGAAPNKLVEAGAPAGVVEFRPPNMEGFAGVEAAAADLFAVVFPNNEGAGVVEAGVVLPNKLLLDWEAGGVLAAGGLLSLLPNKPPDANEPPAVGAVLEVPAAGGVLVFPKTLPEEAGLLAAPPNRPPEDGWEPPPNKPPEAGLVVLLLLLPPNNPPVAPVGVEAPEPEFAPVAAPPNKDLLASAGCAPVLPNKPEPAVEGVVVLAWLLLAPPGLPKEKLDEPDCPPNKPDDEEAAAAGVVEPNREPVAGALEVVALLDWPAALAPPKEKDMIGA